MKFLLTIFLSLFVSQMVISNVQILNSDSDEKIAYDIQEEEEDDSEESEKEDSEKETNEDEKDRNNDFSLDPLSDFQSDLLESHFKQSTYPSVYLNTPYSPPDISC